MWYVNLYLVNELAGIKSGINKSSQDSAWFRITFRRTDSGSPLITNSLPSIQCTIPLGTSVLRRLGLLKQGVTIFTILWMTWTPKSSQPSGDLNPQATCSLGICHGSHTPMNQGDIFSWIFFCILSYSGLAHVLFLIPSKAFLCINYIHCTVP